MATTGLSPRMLEIVKELKEKRKKRGGGPTDLGQDTGIQRLNKTGTIQGQDDMQFEEAARVARENREQEEEELRRKYEGLRLQDERQVGRGLGRGQRRGTREAIPVTRAKKELNWIEAAMRDESFSNESDESFHSVSSESRRGESPLPLRPGELVEDVRDVHKMRSGRPNVSIRQARNWLDSVGSFNLDEEKKIMTLERLLDLEVNERVATALIVPSAGADAGKRLPEVTLILARSLEAQPTRAAEKCMELCLKLFAKCAEHSIDHSRAAVTSVVRGAGPVRFDLLRRLLRLCDVSRGEPLSAELCSFLTEDAIKKCRKGQLHGMIYPGHDSWLDDFKEFDKCLNVFCGLPYAQPVKNMFRDMNGIVEVQDYSEDSMRPLAEVWLDEFEGEMAEAHVDVGNKQGVSAELCITKIYPTGHCLAYAQGWFSTKRILEEISNSLAKFSDFENDYPKTLGEIGSKVTVSSFGFRSEHFGEMNEYSRGCVLYHDKEAGSLAVYLLDFGEVIQVKRDALAPMPAGLEKEPPLIYFLKLQGISGVQNLALNNCASKLLYHLLHRSTLPSLREASADSNVSLRHLCQTLLASGRKYPQLASIKLCRLVLQGQHENGGHKLCDSNEDSDLCDDLAVILADRSKGVIEDALYTLYYCLDMMPSARLFATLDKSQLSATMDSLLSRLSPDDDLTTLAKKIRAMNINGNRITNRQKVSEIRRRHNPLPPPPPQRQPFRRGADHHRRYEDNNRRFYARPRSDYDVEVNRGGARHHTGAMARNPSQQMEQRLDRPTQGEGGAPRPPKPFYMSITQLTEEQQVQGDMPKKRFNSDPEEDQTGKKSPDPTVSATKLFRKEILNVKPSKTDQLLSASSCREIGQDDVGRHICAFLNTKEGGKIYIGVDPKSRMVTGVPMDRKDKDRLRQSKRSLAGIRELVEMLYCTDDGD